MAFKASLLLAFFLLSFTGSLARPPRHQQNQCQLRRIQALEPIDTIQAEAGVTEFWDANDQQFQCAGVEFVRHRIQPGGLFLPNYVNTHLLSFTQQGRGVVGIILPGCPETFESSSEQQSIQDRHQKVQNMNKGDVVAVPAGAAHWIYNDGDTELVVVVFFDTQNRANQLDENLRRFYLAGNPQGQSQQPRQGQSYHNIFNGFPVEILAEAFNVDRETAEKLQGQTDTRGHIVNVGEGLQIIRPPQTRQGQEQEQEQGGRGSRRDNGLEETICSLKLKENIDNPSHVDLANPQAGKISNLNSYKLPILQQLQLSAVRGQLQSNAIQSPCWTLNAHTLVYVTHGSMRVQIVNNEGESVFDDELREGQVVVIPQNFAAIKKASEQGSRWISFKTNENSITSNLAGRVSAIRSLPVDVVANAYQLSRDDAQRLKNNQRQAALFKPSSSRRQSQRWSSA